MYLKISVTGSHVNDLASDPELFNRFLKQNPIWQMFILLTDTTMNTLRSTSFNFVAWRTAIQDQLNVLQSINLIK
jgi:hypothetical protein